MTFSLETLRTMGIRFSLSDAHPRSVSANIKKFPIINERTPSFLEKPFKLFENLATPNKMMWVLKS